MCQHYCVILVYKKWKQNDKIELTDNLITWSFILPNLQQKRG